MRIEIYTNSGKKLIADIFNAVASNKLKTWEVISEGGEEYLAHKAEQWNYRAKAEFKALNDKVCITIKEREGQTSVADIQGYYIGRLTEILLVHYADKFERFEIVK